MSILPRPVVEGTPSSEPWEIPLWQVLEIHDRFSALGGLPGALGDGYLCFHNRLYRNVREAAISLGFTFSDRFAFPYRELPLFCLDDIWEQRCIPIIPNVPALRAVEAKAPTRMLFWEVATGIRRTPTFHEAVHCIARALVRRHAGKGTPQDGLERLILERLFEESCANAAEVVCVALGAGEMHDTFAKLNFYEVHHGVGPTLESLGLVDTIKLLVVSHLFSNFLYDRMPAAEIQRIARRLLPTHAIRALGKAALRDVFRGALTLAPSFRVRIAGVSLKYAGLNGSVFDLLDFEFEEEVYPGGRLHEALAAFAAVMETGSVSA